MKPSPALFQAMIDRAARRSWAYHQFRRDLAAQLKEWRREQAQRQTNRAAAH